MLVGIVKGFVKILVKLPGGDVTSIWKFGSKRYSAADCV